MDLYIPFGYSSPEESLNFGVFSTREKAEEILEEQKKKAYYRFYDVYICELDQPDLF